MAATILDGRELSKAWRAELSESLTALRRGGVEPAVAVVRVGEDPGSVSYARNLARTFGQVEVPCRVEVLPETATAGEVMDLLTRLSGDPSIHGILLQEPVPEPLVVEQLVLAIDPRKDLDGVHPANAGRLFQGRSDGLVPATARGGMELLRRSGIELRGREAVVIGRSTIVGRPFALLLLHAHATVTIAHSRTVDLAAHARRADLLAVAVGRAGFVTPDMVKPGAVVVDFGINYVDGALRGDVDPAAAEVAGALTPVPGGTGSMTTTALLANLIAATEASG